MSSLQAPLFEFFWLTDTGCLRENNEDAVVVEEAARLALLADGMGGYNAGEVASQLVTAFLRDELGRWLSKTADTASDAEVCRAMDACVENANRALHAAAHANPQYAGMGTTLVVAVFRESRLLLGHVGDSRAYRLRGRQLQRLTRDHSLLQEQLDAGLIRPEEAPFAVYRNLITRAMGVQEPVVLEIHQHELRAGDIVLLCSDGLTDMLRDNEIATLLQTQQSSLNEAGTALVSAANAAGGRDNIAVVLVRVRGSDTGGRSWWPFTR